MFDQPAQAGFALALALAVAAVTITMAGAVMFVAVLWIDHLISLAIARMRAMVPAARLRIEAAMPPTIRRTGS